MSIYFFQTNSPYWINVLIDLSPTFITLIIGVIAAYIAYQQYNVNKNKFRFELFETRLESYQKLLKFFRKIKRDGTMVKDDLYTLKEIINNSEFVFGSDVFNYLQEINNKSLIMCKLEIKFNNLKDDEPKTNKTGEEKNDILNWFDQQHQNAHNQYKPYLYFGAKY